MASHYSFTEKEMLGMTVRRFKRYHARIAIHRAQAQLDLLEVLPAPNMKGDDYQRLYNRIARIINPMHGKNIITPRGGDSGR